MKRPECLRRKTDAGMINTWSFGCMLCIYLAVLLMAQIMWQNFFLTSQAMEDALACSNLAALVIDWQEFGNTGEMIIPDEEKAYETFLRALQVNWSREEDVKVEEFVLYQVSAHGTEEVIRGADGVFHTNRYPSETVYAPNGKKVEHTSVYSRISYQVKGIFGETYPATKSKLVDVTTKE